MDGRDYHFVNRERFLQAVEAGELVEWAEYGGHLYGTPWVPLQEAQETGADVLLDIEIVGSRAVKERFPDAVMVWIEPPDMGELERRLRSRGDTSSEDMSRRLAVAEEHSREARSLFDHFVVNGELSAAIDEVTDILASDPEPRDHQ